MDTDTNTMLIALAVVVLIAIALWMVMRKQRTDHLARRFGPEYDRTVNEMGSRDKAEAELLARKKRVDELDIVPLSPADAQRFSQDWRALQARFVDNPRGVLADADLLVRELMQKRGYPMGDFERRAADISVHHPGVVEHYRAAHDITQRDHRGQVDTEGMRQAVIHYRALFAELLQVDEPHQPTQRHPEMRTQS
jgi:ABC-type nickel/cobalt efflux system permease component RcnA